MKIKLREVSKRITAFLCALAVLTIELPAFAAEPSGLRINELQSDNGGSYTSTDGEHSDWIELYNASDAAVELNGLCLMLEEKPGKILVFSAQRLEAGQCLLIEADGTSQGLRNGVWHAPFRIPSGGGVTLRLARADGSELDRVAIPALQQDQVLARNEAGEWQPSLHATPGRPNESAATTVSGAQPTGAGDIELTEVMTSNPIYPIREGRAPCDYIELHNSGTQTIDLEGYSLTDDPAEPKKWSFPSVELAADAYLLLSCDGTQDGELCTGFRLSSEGEQLSLYSPEGELLRSVSVPALEAGQAWSLVGYDWTAVMAPTPGAANSPEQVQAWDARLRAMRTSSVRISEIMAAPADEAHDWIELYNEGSEIVDLSGWGLSDRASHPRKWQFPQGTSIAPGEYLCVWMISAEEAPESTGINAGFALASAGGYHVTLCEPDGTLADTIRLPEQIEGISYGRTPSGSCGYLETATPGKANPDRCSEAKATLPSCSVKGGIYEKPTVLTVELVSDPGVQIHYTLDSSAPDESSPVYDGAPLRIADTTILRARAMRDGWISSEIATESYLFDIPNASDATYVVSLVADPDDLYSDRRGILAKGPNATDSFPYGSYGRGANFWMDWEREAHVELFSSDAGTVISQRCGIKVHGRNSRGYRLKSLKLIARSSYGDSRFRYPVFSHRDYDEYDALLLRYSGQDYSYAYMRDPVLTRQAAEGTDILYQEFEIVLVYLNGKYYSLGYVREVIDAFSICRDNGWEGAEDTIDLVKGGESVMRGSDESYIALKKWLKSNDANTGEAYDRIDSAIDIDNFLYYCAMVAVIGTSDTVNVKRYRDPNGDGRWRWCLYDVDRGMRDKVDTMSMLAKGTNGILFKACMSNETIRARFTEILDELMAGGLSPQSVTDAIETNLKALEPMLPAYLKMMDIPEKSYRSYVNSFIGSAEKAPARALSSYRRYFGLSESQLSTLFPRTYAMQSGFSED